METKRFTRFEFIGPDGREIVRYGFFDALVQDDGRTLKVFEIHEQEYPGDQAVRD